MFEVAVINSYIIYKKLAKTTTNDPQSVPFAETGHLEVLDI